MILFVHGGGGVKIADSYCWVRIIYSFCTVGVSKDALGSGILHTADRDVSSTG